MLCFRFVDMKNTIDKEVIEIMACNKCGSNLHLFQKEEEQFLKCSSCGKEFKIRDGIIIME